MPEYPKDVVAISMQGKAEVRILIDKGRFVKYNYKDIKTGRVTSKFSIILRNSAGKEEHLTMIPLKGRFLALPMKGDRSSRKVWNPGSGKTSHWIMALG